MTTGKRFINEDHDPADYRVCELLHPMRRFELKGQHGNFIGYVCDVCERADRPCIRFPHAERMGEIGGARWYEEFVTRFFVVVAHVTFGLIDPYDFYERAHRDDDLPE